MELGTNLGANQDTNGQQDLLGEAPCDHPSIGQKSVKSQSGQRMRVVKLKLDMHLHWERDSRNGLSPIPSPLVRLQPKFGEYMGVGGDSWQGGSKIYFKYPLTAGHDSFLVEGNAGWCRDFRVLRAYRVERDGLRASSSRRRTSISSFTTANRPLLVTW